MATLILSAAGAALGGAMGGSVLGVSAAMLGRAAGATLGNAIDQRLLGSGSQVVQTGRATTLRMMGGREGNPVSRVYGRMRVSGQVIWSSRFKETSTTSNTGKWLQPQPSVRSYAYSISFAIGLCEGEIVRVGRIWADGKLLAQKHLNFRVHTGSEQQLPDPLIEAIEGVQNVSAFRGLAYVVFEDLPLEDFGNRIPQISVEVFRRAGTPHVADLISGVALVPGSGEYALATEPVVYELGKGKSRSANVNNANGRPDFVESMRQLTRELPNCGSVSVVVNWFGDDLRCDRCKISPRVEQKADEGSQVWQVSGQGRASAATVSLVGGKPAFGGTPSDGSVLQALRYLRESGKRVMFYPFVMMDIQAGNGLVDPWSGGDDQPVVPWRGRITLANAPGREGSSDKSLVAIGEVQNFFGEAEAGDFTAGENTVEYVGPQEWSYRRFILHYAKLCVLAGGVDSFCLGSELRGLTHVRSAVADFPAVDQLKALATEVRAIVGPDCKLTYAADWSEYFSYQPQDGSGDVLFHLDALWSDPNIDFVGIDNYVPLADWRNEADHLDAAWGSSANLGYLSANIEGGEGYDWYYESPAKRDLQLRTPIQDGAFGEDWIYRNKDFRNWWLNAHHNRIGGIRSEQPTGWIAQSKPLAFTELGCPAVHNGANQPNMFVDERSIESGLPWYSNGGQDDAMQQAYLQAVLEYWGDAANNPVADGYDGRLVDVARAHVWAWDTRPWPDFPARADVWSDARNFERGHWINGRIGNVPLADVVADICLASGLVGVDVANLSGAVKGYDIAAVETARQSLQPLMLAFGFDSAESGDAIKFRGRHGVVDARLPSDGFAQDSDDGAGYSITRANSLESSARLRLNFVQSDGDYQEGSVEFTDPLQGDDSVAVSDVPILMSASEGRNILERWTAEVKNGLETVSFALPPSLLATGVGDVLELNTSGSTLLCRVDRIENRGSLHIEATSIEASVYAAKAGQNGDGGVGSWPIAAMPVYAEFLDLPMFGAKGGPQIAVAAEPWPGAVAIYAAAGASDYALMSSLRQAAIVGTTLAELPPAAPDIWLPGSLRVQMSDAGLSSRASEDVLNGANVLAIRNIGATQWEIVQFCNAILVGPAEYQIEKLLRGQAGTDFLSRDAILAGADIVVVDARLAPVDLASDVRGLPRNYRAGPAQEPWSDASYRQWTWTYGDVASRPYAPAHLRASRLANGDIAIRWIRRARLDGDSWQGPDVPLGEAFERYEVRIGGETRASHSDKPEFLYSTNDQNEDGLSAPYFIEVAQISERFGTGPHTRIEFND